MKTAALPGVQGLKSAFHSASSGTIATLTTDVSLGSTGRDNPGAVVKTFDDRTFQATGKRTLPGFIVASRQFFPGSGQFVFMSNSGRRTYVVMRTGPDPLAGFDQRLSGAVYDSAVVATDTDFQPEVPLSLSAQGSLLVRGMLESPTTATGSAVLRTLGGSVAAAATLNYRLGGVMVSEATVPVSSPIRSGRFYAEVGGRVNTGVAFANPSDQTAVVRFYYTSAAGRSAEGSFSLPPRGQIARFLDENPFTSVGTLTGLASLTFTSNVAIGAIALRTYTNERSEFLFTTMPVTDLEAFPLSGVVVFPHFAIGAGWRSQIVLVNPTDQPIAGSLAVWGQGTPTRAAQPLSVSIGGLVGSTFQFDLPAGAARQFDVNPITSGLIAGSIRVTSTGPAAPAGSVIFSYAIAGVTLSTAGVPATRPANAVRLFAQGTYQFYPALPLSTDTGLAIANLSPTPVQVTLQLTKPDGRSYGDSVVQQVPGNGQIAAFMRDLGFFPSGYYLLRVTTDSPSGIGVLGILGRYNERREFLLSTTPVYREDESSGSVQVLPHFAQGGGFTTELLLFNRNDAAATTSLLTSFGPDGSAFDLDLRLP